MTQPCGHDEQWLAFRNPVDPNSDHYCLFCECERLQAIVDLLKKTKDGMPVVPHYTTRLFYVHPGSGELYERTYEADMADARSCYDKDIAVVWVSVEDCYSTKEAAEAARSKT